MLQSDEIEIDGKNVLMSAISLELELQDYEKIMQSYKTVDISTCRCFQRTFNKFYKIIWVSNKWREHYYKVFEEKKNLSSVTFEEILNEICIDERVEASFASKMLATINPDMPIWDKHVLEQWHLSLSGNKKLERLTNAVKVYDKLCSKYKNYMRTDNAQTNIRIFDKLLPDHKMISNVKKIDYLIWLGYMENQKGECDPLSR